MKHTKIGFNGRKQKGFTLIELLMVVVILGILAYVSMSAFSGSPNAANATAIRSGATEIAKGVGYIHANIGNGIKTQANALKNTSATMLDVLMIGRDAVAPAYQARFDKLEMRPLESEFRVLNRGGSTKGEYNLLSYKVEVTDICPAGKVCVTFDDVPDAVRDEILVRYGLDTTTANINVVTASQSLPVAYTANAAAGTNVMKFALIP